MRINGEYLSNLRLADDIVLFSNNGDELQQMIEDLNRESGAEDYYAENKGDVQQSGKRIRIQDRQSASRVCKGVRLSRSITHRGP